MSGAGAAMRQVIARRDRRRLDSARLAALGDMAAQTRELIENVLLTGADSAALVELTATLAELNAALAPTRQPAPPVTGLDEDGVVRHLSGPVTGKLNPIAAPIEMVPLPDGTVRCEFTLSIVYEGPPGFVHGGVSALVLDNLLGSAAAYNGTPGMTATLSMTYRRPTPHGVPLVGEAKTVRVDGRKTYVDGWIAGPDGKRTVEATAMFVRPLR